MKTAEHNQLRRAVRRALDQLWPTVVEAHPVLARVVDRDLLLDAAVDHFGDDETYQHALADAAARGLSDTTVGQLVARLARRWLRGAIAPAA